MEDKKGRLKIRFMLTVSALAAAGLPATLAAQTAASGSAAVSASDVSRPGSGQTAETGQDQNPQPDVETRDTGVDASDGSTIIVTASRRAQRLRDAPVSISVADPDALALGGLTSLEDVVNYTPGVNFQEGGSPGRQTITMRGVTQTLGSPTVGIYLDDIPVGGAGQWGEAGSLMPDLVQANLERIEFVKGPQGTLYGTSAMGGVVRYISRDPTGDLGGGFAVDLSETRRGALNRLSRGWANLPLIQDRVGLSISGYSSHEGGFIDRAPASVAGPAPNVNSADTLGGMVQFVAHPTDRLSASLLYTWRETTYSGINSIDLAGPPFAPIAGPYLSLQGGQDSRTSLEIFGGTLSYDMGWATFLSSTAYQTIRDVSRSDQTIIFAPLVELLAGVPPGSVTSVNATAAVETNRFTQEVRLSSRQNGRFEWILGGFFSDEDSADGESIVGQPINFAILDYQLPASTREIAAFGNATYYFTPQLDVTLGARVAWVETGVALTDIPGILVQDIPLTTAETSVTTYLLSLRYRPSPETSLYARIASGYRPSGASLPILDQTGNPLIDPIIETDTLWSYEAGIKGTLWGRLLSYDLAGWYLNWKNLQAVIFVQGISTGGNANSDVTAYGAEGTLTLTPMQGLRITGTFAFTNSDLDSDETAAFGGLAGERMPLVPRWTWSLDSNYEFALGSGLRAFAGGGIRHIGARNSGFEGGIGQDGQVITPIIGNIPLDAYTVVDLRAGITQGPVTLSLYATNLFDEYGLVSATARPVVQGVVANASVLRPRTFGAVLTTRF